MWWTSTWFKIRIFAVSIATKWGVTFKIYVKFKGVIPKKLGWSGGLDGNSSKLSQCGWPNLTVNKTNSSQKGPEILIKLSRKSLTVGRYGLQSTKPMLSLASLANNFRQD